MPWTAPYATPRAMTTPAISAPAVMSTPSERTSRSRSLGMNAMTSAPTRGRNVAIEMAQFSHPLFIRSPSPGPSDPGDHDGQHDYADEQERRVALDIARLQVAEQPAGEPGGLRHPVHRAVDDGAVELVRPQGQILGEPGRPAHHAVQDVSVEPHRRGGQAVPDREDDPVHVHLVEVE